MKISGFTLIRNGVRFDYPFLEAFRSILPLVDELIINVGTGEDETRARIAKFAAEEGAGKVLTFDSDWPMQDPVKMRGGQILSEQTNLALDRCSGDWCIYVQSDEVFHEEDIEKVRTSLAEADRDSRVDGLVFDYLHFYGSFDVIQQSRSAYRREVRAIRRKSGARSVGDAQSFRMPDGSKVPAIRARGARVFHYGWVRPPEAMREKTVFMDQLYHGGAKQGQTVPFTGENYRYKRFVGLKRYEGTHPSVMRERIRSRNWKWNLEESPLVWTLGDWKKIVLDGFEALSGIRLFEYRSYRWIKED